MKQQGVSVKDDTTHVVIDNLPPSNERLPLFIIGDVHGCAKELDEIITLAKKKVSQFQTVLVGDLFTKGPDPVGVYDIIMKQKAICIKGNHDWALKALISKSQKSTKGYIAKHSLQTLKLIRHHKKLIYDLIGKQPCALTTTIQPQTAHIGWEKEYRLVVLHAGYDAVQGLKKTTERVFLTARHVKFAQKDGRNILMPVNSIDVPEEQKHTKVFRWHELHKGPDLIIFGHDAKQGLFRKTLDNGRPICIGLDTGCTYGKFLTGYFPETDFAIQVKAHRIYFDVKENIILLK